MRNMCANRVARGHGSTFSRGKGHESAMTASSGFKRSCDYNKKATKRPSVSNLCACLTGDHKLRAAREEVFGVVCITYTFTTIPTIAPNRKSVATAGAAAIPAATTATTATDAVMAAALTRAEPTRQSQLTVHPCPACSGYCPTYSGYCPACFGYCSACPGYWTACCSSYCPLYSGHG